MRFVRQRGAVSQGMVAKRFGSSKRSVRNVLDRLIAKGLMTRGVGGSFCTFESTELVIRRPPKTSRAQAEMVRDLVLMDGGETTTRQILDMGGTYLAIKKAIALKMLTRKGNGVITTKLDFERPPTAIDVVLAAMNKKGKPSLFWQITETTKMDRRHVEIVLRRLITLGLVEKTARGVYVKK
jgi:predicted transcriptional regulator